MLDLQERLYTSTEVAEILGVSLRSVYRYLEEGKLNAEVKTATGRHRFTKKNILDFLYPDGKVPTGAIPEQKQKDISQSTMNEVNQDMVMPSVPIRARPQPQTQTQTQTQPQPQNQTQPQAKTQPQPYFQAAETTMPEEVKKSEVKQEEVTQEEPVDWLAKFREAAKKFREEEEASEKAKVARPQEVKQEPAVDYKPEPKVEPRKEEPRYYNEAIKPTREAPVSYSADETITGLGASYKPEKEKPSDESFMYFYKSGLGGLKDIAQNIDKVARNSELSYAFTLNAGLSLFKPIKPFSLLHVYVKSEDKEFFEKMLRLSPSTEEDSQLCLIQSKSSGVFTSSTEMHGLFVVSKEQLLKDIKQVGDTSLLEEAKGILN